MHSSEGMGLGVGQLLHKMGVIVRVSFFFFFFSSTCYIISKLFQHLLYNIKAFAIKQIHWEILGYPSLWFCLSNSIPERPNIFRRPKNLRGYLPPSRVQSQILVSPGWSGVFNQKSSYRCGVSNCGACHYMWHRKRSVTGNCQTYTIQQLINGETQFVVYCLFMYALGACSVTLHALYRHGLGCIRETTSNAVVFFFFLFF